MSEHEIEQIMNSFYMPEIDNINDEIEFDIEKYKEELIRNSKNKIEDFKKDFEADAKNMISQKFNTIKNNINKLVLSSQKEQEKNLELKEEEDNKMNNGKGKLKNQLLGKKNEFSEIIKKQDNYTGGVIDMISENDDDNFKNKDQLMIKFEKEEIKHAVNIKEAKLFKIDNIKLSNFGMREFNNLFFVIDIDKSPKNLLFYENFTNKANHKLSPSWSFQREENINNNATFFFKDPKVGENSIFIYVSEKQNGENLSLPLKITVKLIEDQNKNEREKRNIKLKENKNEKNKKQEEFGIKFKKKYIISKKENNTGREQNFEILSSPKEIRSSEFELVDENFLVSKNIDESLYLDKYVFNFEIDGKNYIQFPNEYILLERLINKNLAQENKVVDNKVECKIYKEEKKNRIENQNKEYINKINEFEKYIKELESKIKEKNRIINEEKIKNENLNKKLKELQNISNKNLDINNIIELKNEIKLFREYNNFSEGEKLISINFASLEQDIDYSIIIKNTEIFSKIEIMLYNKYPKYTETENYFLVGGNRINRHKTLEKNNIKNNDIITLYINNFD